MTKKFLPSMEPEGSLPCSQKPATGLFLAETIFLLSILSIFVGYSYLHLVRTILPIFLRNNGLHYTRNFSMTRYGLDSCSSVPI